MISELRMEEAKNVSQNDRLVHFMLRFLTDILEYDLMAFVTRSATSLPCLLSLEIAETLVSRRK